jgi:hypothetical protein
MVTAKDYWGKANQLKKLASQAARINIQQQLMSKRCYDNRRINSIYNEGKLVWVRVLSGRSKFDP